MVEVSPVVAVAVSGGFALSGVLLKAALDGLSAKRRSRRDDSRRFEAERADLVAQFLASFRRELDHSEHVHRMAVELARDPDAQPPIPDRPTELAAELLATLDKLRLSAHTLPVIHAAEQLVASLGSLSHVSRSVLHNGFTRHDDMRWFILLRVTHELEAAFVNAARVELGLGAPAGAPAWYPMRPLPAGTLDVIRRFRPELLPPPPPPRRRLRRFRPGGTRTGRKAA